jgi:transcriptional regulator with XRE-family HTH domain
MNIAPIRRLRGLTQVDLADMTGLTQPTISRAENGEEGTTLGTFKLIAEALGVSLADLFADDRTKVEAELLGAFRRLPIDRQKGWLDMARSVVSDHQQ